MERLKVLGEKTQGNEHKLGYYDYILKFSYSCLTLEQVSQRDNKIFTPGFIQNSTGHNSEQFDPVGSAFSKRLDQVTSRCPCQSKLLYNRTASL